MILIIQFDILKNCVNLLIYGCCDLPAVCWQFIDCHIPIPNIQDLSRYNRGLLDQEISYQFWRAMSLRCLQAVCGPEVGGVVGCGMTYWQLAPSHSKELTGGTSYVKNVTHLKASLGDALIGAVIQIMWNTLYVRWVARLRRLPYTYCGTQSRVITLIRRVPISCHSNELTGGSCHVKQGTHLRGLLSSQYTKRVYSHALARLV